MKKTFHKFVLFCLCCWSLNGVFGESVSVMEGDSVTLKTNVTEICEGDNIQWKYGAKNSVIAKMKKRKQKDFTDKDTDGRFENKLKLDNQTGSLTITNITIEYAGYYQLEITGENLTSKAFNVSVYARLPVPVISSNSSQCPLSSNCSLVCSVVNVSDVTLSWYKGNSLMSSISVSDLSISLSLPLEVEYQDKNTYSCVLNNSISNQTQHLDISKLCHTCADSVSLIVLISAAAAAAGSLLIVAAVVIVCIGRKHRKTDIEVEICEEEITYVEMAFYKRNTLKPKVEKEDRVEYAPIRIRR
ncbi:SLAM family member 5-like [Garra rufa]|uniref:SLAM family member 5-like n=1 Tax=Garra rufa TaxID=137080 RepID=UPI003CCEDCDE